MSSLNQSVGTPPIIFISPHSSSTITPKGLLSLRFQGRKILPPMQLRTYQAGTFACEQGQPWNSANLASFPISVLCATHSLPYFWRLPVFFPFSFTSLFFNCLSRRCRHIFVLSQTCHPSASILSFIVLSWILPQCVALYLRRISVSPDRPIVWALDFIWMYGRVGEGGVDLTYALCGSRTVGQRGGPSLREPRIRSTGIVHRRTHCQAETNAAETTLVFIIITVSFMYFHTTCHDQSLYKFCLFYCDWATGKIESKSTLSTFLYQNNTHTHFFNDVWGPVYWSFLITVFYFCVFPPSELISIRSFGTYPNQFFFVKISRKTVFTQSSWHGNEMVCSNVRGHWMGSSLYVM